MRAGQAAGNEVLSSVDKINIQDLSSVIMLALAVLLTSADHGGAGRG